LTGKYSVANRCLPLDGQKNFRDLGGYGSIDGRTVKYGQLYRSGDLSKLSPADLVTLKRLGIQLIIDLREGYEVEQSPDRLPQGARPIWLPINGGDLPMEQIYLAASGGDMSAIDTSYLVRSNRLFVQKFTPQYAQMLRHVSAVASRPAVVHCSAGKDRAGLGAAILLWTLGVPTETVFADYLVTNVCRAADNESILDMVRQMIAATNGAAPESVDVSPIAALLEARRAYLQAALETILDLYGSIEGYIRDGLGMTAVAQAQFQDALLE
jgi:protein-tyrosine phosphatase